MSHHEGMDPEKALERLKRGNAHYVCSDGYSGDVSCARRRQTFENGQTPYAIVVSCSDSRVIPEAVFSAGIGELFVIRVAGNVIDRHQLGSIEYAAEHLGCRLAVVLGHTGCGAVGAALAGGADGFVSSITDEIRLAFADERDAYRAGCLNAERSADMIRRSLGGLCSLTVVAAMCHIDTGLVEFL